METPFKNDAFAMIWQAFKALYPDKQCEVWWEPVVPDNAKNSYGMTLFPDTGDPAQVFIYSCYPVDRQAEILAHELAHVAVGQEHGHDETWDAAFTAIQLEYERIGTGMFGGARTN